MKGAKDSRWAGTLGQAELFQGRHQHGNEGCGAMERVKKKNLLETLATGEASEGSRGG